MLACPEFGEGVGAGHGVLMLSGGGGRGEGMIGDGCGNIGRWFECTVDIWLTIARFS